jgi:hypothetical protein
MNKGVKLNFDRFNLLSLYLTHTHKTIISHLEGEPQYE